MDRISFAQLFNALPSPHTLLDLELRYVAANHAYQTALMRPEEELVGRNLFEVFPNTADVESRLRNSLLRVIETAKPDTLAYIHYRIERPEHFGGGIEDRYWTAVHSPLFDKDGNVIFILQNTVDITELVRLRESAAVPFRIMPGELELVQRAREAEEAYSLSRDESTHFHRLFQQAPSMVAVLQGPDHIFTFANEAYRHFIGDRDPIGLSVRSALPEVVEQGLVELLDEVYRAGTARIAEGRRIEIRRRAGGPLEDTYLDFSYHPILDQSGRVSGVFVQATDRTDSILYQQRQRLMVDELNHRVKNTLSSVQSIARQSFKREGSAARSLANFEARIQALSKAHDALSERHWESVDLKTIALQELAVYESVRVSADGPLVRLSPKAAIAFAMVFHELASNATKYGSLAVEGGSVDISWDRSNGRLSIEWKESGIQITSETLEPGFGIRMLERIIKGELDGELDLAFSKSGLICRIHMALSEVEDIAGVASG